MAEENKKLQITVPTVFDAKENPDVKIVSIVDATSDNKFRSLGVPMDAVHMEARTDKDGKALRPLYHVDLDTERVYDTSVRKTDGNGNPYYEHTNMNGQEIYDKWTAQRDNKQQVIAKEPVPTEPAKPVTAGKNIILNNVPAEFIRKAPEGSKGKPDLIRIPDTESACGHGNLRVMPSRVFKQPNRSAKLGELANANVFNVNLGPEGSKLYYQIQTADGKWAEKMNADGKPFTNVDLQSMWKEQQANLMAERAGAIMEKGDALAQAQPSQPSSGMDSYDPDEDEAFV